MASTNSACFCCATSSDTCPGSSTRHQFEITVDGVRIFLSHVGGEEDNKMMDTNLGLAGNTIDARLECACR